MTASTQTDQALEQSTEVSSENTHSPGRRRLIQGATIAPVLLVSGRSALACNPNQDNCALSPMAWLSLHPQNQTATAQLSHSVGSNFLGKSPGYWKPNTGPNAQVFQGAWPANTPPFNNLTVHNTDSSGNCLTAQKKTTWNAASWKTYKGLPAVDSCTGKDPGWQTGAKLPFGSDTRSISRILMEDNGTVLWHFCAAYLNALTYPNAYALTVDELTKLYNYQPITAGARVLQDAELKAFLEQTWV